MMAKKRGNGEGSIYRCKDRPGYRAAYTVQTARGPRRRYVSGRTRRKVEEKLTKAKAERDGGVVFDAKNLTLDEYLDRWLSDSVRGSVKQSTLENYEYAMRLHVVPTLGRTKLNVLTPTYVQALYRSKLDGGLSARTVQLIHTVLHKALKQAVRWELVPKNVTESADAPRPSRHARKEIHPLTRDQTRALLGAARGDRLEALYVVAITTGLREGELLGLRWMDVDLENSALAVRQQLTRTKEDGLCFTTPKSPKSRRSVQLTQSTIGILAAHRERQQEERSKMNGQWDDAGLVFTSTIGTPVDVGNMTYRSFRPLLERADLPRIRFHDLRHTCATLLLSKGTHPKIVQEMLGHANISETMDTYSHVLPGMQDGAVSVMEDALR